ncbi:quinoprotein relay system zinc metallohydrolase 2 [Acuticoccus sp. I52.16.1]|uniref:quinoprotein relay system zinc metallohydrolase 2 n=1 Tax=Acuticoccus sp. I52.16.1 TaxID=2928472 RepID=UPI001FD14752|nr:quinoprotein relay system zinc metallohydrolase 2 [Acuticoccus sp. I52.16.1]UOM35450.1 quinoprotein relay system zinc metallohydrolase 2 [Acuticoccus sp. I52.16.1]
MRLAPAAFALGLLAVTVLAQAHQEVLAQPPRAVGEAAGDALTTVEIAPGVYVHEGAEALAAPDNRGDIANLGFVVGAEGVAVIDTGGSVAIGRALLAAIREVTALPVLAVINTHMHPDHTFGNAAFRGAGPQGADPAFFAHAKLGRALAVRAGHYRASTSLAMGDAGAGPEEIVLPDRDVAEGGEIDLGGRVLRLTAWPTAHTDNDLTVLDLATGTLFAGDLVFVHHLPVVDGSIAGWLAVHPRLAELSATRVVPGHGPAAVPWPAALAPQRRYLEGVAAEVRRAIAEGTPLARAVADAPEPAAGWVLVDAFHRRNVTAAYAELEWE